VFGKACLCGEQRAAVCVEITEGVQSGCLEIGERCVESGDRGARLEFGDKDECRV
jgi:hypothetical protein